jgi:hypothetical protein
VGKQHGVEHGPQNIKLELEDEQHPLLQFSGIEMAERDAQPMHDIAWRFVEAAAEVVVTSSSSIHG